MPTKAQWLIALCVLLGSLSVSSVETAAQSVITGVVKDQSGAVLPGVTVEASSAALIEGARTSMTDSDGLYRIVDLRPGTYVIRFTLSGFESVRREGVELPSDFTATVNADLRLGALEESITVSGASPLIDVQSTARTQVATRETLDAIPTGRSFQAFAALVLSVRMNSLDIGGARGSTQTYMSLRGLDAAQSTLFVDGLPVTPGCCGQVYYSDAMNQEISYQTSSLPAEVSTGGVRANLIPKDGGNRFSGVFVGAYRDGAWQGSNLTQDLIDRGLTRIDKFEQIYDVDGALGGPIVRDRLPRDTAQRGTRVALGLVRSGEFQGPADELQRPENPSRLYGGPDIQPDGWQSVDHLQPQSRQGHRRGGDRYVKRAAEESLYGLHAAGVDGHTTGAPSYGSAFLITRATRYPASCPAPCPANALVLPSLTLPSLTVPLQPYASVFTERVNEVELRIAKAFQRGRVSLEPRLEVFNLLNSDTATAWRSVNYGTSTYLQPSAVPPARFVGFSLQVGF